MILSLRTGRYWRRYCYITSRLRMSRECVSLMLVKIEGNDGGGDGGGRDAQTGFVTCAGWIFEFTCSRWSAKLRLTKKRADLKQAQSVATGYSRSGMYAIEGPIWRQESENAINNRRLMNDIRHRIVQSNHTACFSVAIVFYQFNYFERIIKGRRQPQ